MDVIRIMTDFIETGEHVELATCLKNKIQTDIYEVRVKNKEFMLKYLQPSNDFIIHTTAMPCVEPHRLLA